MVDKTQPFSEPNRIDFEHWPKTKEKNKNFQSTSQKNPFPSKRFPSSMALIQFGSSLIISPDEFLAKAIHNAPILIKITFNAPFQRLMKRAKGKSFNCVEKSVVLSTSASRTLFSSVFFYFLKFFPIDFSYVLLFFIDTNQSFILFFPPVFFLLFSDNKQNR